MKRIIFFVALTVMGILVMAQAQDTQAPPMNPGCSLTRPAVNHQIFGHGYETTLGGEDDFKTKGLIVTKAVGYPGPAQFTVSYAYQQMVPIPDERCPEGSGAIDIVKVVWGEIYEDNSLLSGALDADQVFCYNPATEVQTADLTGTITGGLGRFEGATGTWRATVQNASGSFTGNLTVYCDN